MRSPLTADEPVAGYESNVFINCPFDKEYYALLRPLLFTIIYLGYNPRIASERSDSAENRVDKICELIRDSKYSIHDFSRLKASRAKEYYRLNMPFEFGVEYGGRLFGASFMNQKKCLILERRLYDFKRALSDLSGVDIKSHKNKPDEAMVAEGSPEKDIDDMPLPEYLDYIRDWVAEHKDKD